MQAKQIRSVPLPIWQELLVGVEMVYLRLSPVYWGWGIPAGDGSAVVVVPGFLGADFYLKEFREWLRRIGYKPYKSCIGWNAECPNLLLRSRLSDTIEKAYQSTQRKVHVVGHSLGGIIARAAAAQMPDRIASVISLGAPFREVAVHGSVRRAAELVRRHVLDRHGTTVMPDCYTTECTCNFLHSLVTDVPGSVNQSAIYSKADGIVDWRCCVTGDPEVDVEVSATHIGMAFNPLVYQLVAERLAAAQVQAQEVRSATRNRSAASRHADRPALVSLQLPRPCRTARSRKRGAHR